MTDAKQLVEQIAAEADATADEPMPPGTVWTRPGATGQARSTQRGIEEVPR